MRASYATGRAPGNVATADLNGDGSADVVVANWYGAGLTVYGNNGAGTLFPYTPEVAAYPGVDMPFCSGILALEQEEYRPIVLPTPEDVLKRALDLERRIATNPGAARDELRRLFKDQAITLELGPDRVYVARSEVLPLVFLGIRDPSEARGSGQVLDISRPQKLESPSGGIPEGLLAERSSGGRI